MRRNPSPATPLIMDGLWIFGLPRDADVTALAQAVGSGAAVDVRGPLRGVRERLDTFDWRLFRAGITLEFEQTAGDGPRLRLLDPGRSAGPLEVRVARRPDLVTSLASSALRRRLGPLMDVRALLPRNRVRGSLHEIQIRDRRQKTVARIHLWRPSRRGDCVVRVQAVRGYESQARRAARRLGNVSMCRALDDDPLWLEADGGAAAVGEYPGWQVPGLAPRLRTDDGLQRALAHYRGVMDLNLPGMLADLDSEFLHDFRVGLRRSRTLVRRIPGVFPEGRIGRFRDDLAWLSAVTGPPRDAHVHCLVFADYAAGLDPRFADALQPLFEHVRRAQTDAHAALVAAVDSPRFRRRWSAWGRFLQRPMPRASRQRQGTRSLEHTAGSAVRRALRRMQRKGRRITASSAPPQYHDLRKSGKDLRYLLDVLGEFLDPAATGRMLRQLKKLQDLLGEHQDLDVHRDALLGIHRSMADRGEMSGETHAAMEHLVQELARRSAAVRERFPRRFDAFLAACPKKVRSVP